MKEYLTKEQTDKLFNTITSNGCREMEEDRFHQAVNEAINISSQLEPPVSDDFGGKGEEKRLRMLDNLLCTIHRDGGHFISGNGYAGAYNKAMEKIIDWIRRDDSQNSR